MNYYNEFDPFAAAWLRELINRGLIPLGDVDDRSIADVQPGDLDGYTQCHFFAGIGGWPYALQLAGWPADRPVWTGSCPCQPFSVAGKGKGEKDPRHLWPEFHRLIAERKPSACFGEQVASKAGRGWLAGVRADLEELGYAVGAADLCAASTGAPHIRQRLFWLADRAGTGLEGASRAGIQDGVDGFAVRSEDGGLEHTGGAGLPKREGHTGIRERQVRAQAREIVIGPGAWAESRPILCSDEKTRRVPIEPAFFPLADGLPAEWDDCAAMAMPSSRKSRRNL